MSKVYFPLFKEDADGNIILDRTLDTNNFTATKDGNSFSTTFYHDGNGFYSFDVSGSGTYSTFYAGIVQDEFQNIYIAQNDVLKLNQVDNSTIQVNNGLLEVVNGTTLLRQTDIVDNLQSTSSLHPLSANQGLQLSSSIATKEPADTTILKEDDIVFDFLTGGNNKVQSAQSLLLNLRGTNYLNNITTYSNALRELDRRIQLFSIGGSYKQLIAFGKSGTVSVGTSNYLHTAGNGAGLNSNCRIINQGNITAISVQTYCLSISSPPDTLKINIYKNGEVYHTFYFDVSQAGAFGQVSYLHSLPVSPNDSIGLVFQNDSENSSSFVNTVCLLEIES